VLTIFCTPKPFEGEIATIQRNAIRSWKRLRPACEVVVLGDEAGFQETVSEFELKHVPEVERNEFGTPLLRSVCELAEAASSHDRLCYANADLILFPDFLRAIVRVEAEYRRSLGVGETRDLDVPRELEEGGDWDALRQRALTSGTARGRAACDFFVFLRGSLGRLPDFAVGRPYWDPWMIWNARNLRMPVIDVSPSTLVVHQEHGYGHVPHATGPKWEGPEAERNRELLGEPEHTFWLDDATHRLSEGELVRSTGGGFAHRLGNELLLRPHTIRLYRILRSAYLRSRAVVSGGAAGG
jgi:hypothetical protein